MAGPITTGNHPKALWPGVEGHWWGMYEAHDKEYDKIFDKVSSKWHTEEYPMSTSFGLAVQKDESTGISFDSHQQGFNQRVKNVTIGLGYVVTAEEIEDNLYKERSFDRAGMLAFSMNTTKEVLGANILNLATDTSTTYSDGKELLATDHPLISGGTFSNELSVAAALSESAIEDLSIQIMGATNDRGLEIKLMPDCLIVPRQLWYEAHRILDSVLQNDTSNNAVNVLRAANTFPGGIVMNHYLTDSNNWFIKTNLPQGKGLIYQERRPIQFTRDNDFHTDNALAKATERYEFSVVDPRGIYGSAPA